MNSFEIDKSIADGSFSSMLEALETEKDKIKHQLSVENATIVSLEERFAGSVMDVANLMAILTGEKERCLRDASEFKFM
jgi:hypothetical protein